ncbi:MAG: hypothetical protein ABJN40_16220 [Sneathiella sp.]
MHIWRDHLIILTVFAGLTIPVYFVDAWLLKSSRGALFSLQGLFISFYLIGIAVHALVSTAGHYFFKKTGMAILHCVSLVLSVILVVIGLFVIESLHQRGRTIATETLMAERAERQNVLTLVKWQYGSSSGKPESALITVRTAQAGRFAARIDARGHGDYSKEIFAGELESQVHLAAGDTVTLTLMLNHYSDEKIGSITLTLSLFQKQKGGHDKDIRKIYMPDIQAYDDGRIFYDRLPEPVSNL